MASYSDLSGIFFIQQQYLADLSALTQTSSVTGSYVTNLRNKLNDLYNAYSVASPSANAVLDKQKDMLNIINNENTRLDNKLQVVDNATYGQNRMAHFSSSYAKKYYAQSKILFIIICILLIYLGLTVLNIYIPIPDAFFNFVMYLIIGGGLFVIVSVIFDINKRYHMDFDKLATNAPAGSDARGGTGNAGDVGIGSNLNVLCVGESCCPPGNINGAYWNAELQQCISPDTTSGASIISTTPNLPSLPPNISNLLSDTPADTSTSGTPRLGFTLMSQTKNENNSQFAVCQVKPYEPSEITKYTKINV